MEILPPLKTQSQKIHFYVVLELIQKKIFNKKIHFSFKYFINLNLNFSFIDYYFQTINWIEDFLRFI